MENMQNSASQTRKLSGEGVSALKYSEGLRLEAYKNFKNEPWTIGYGHTGADVYEGLVITEKRAEQLLLQDLDVFENVINRYVDVQLMQWQFDALVNFVYNIGEGQFNDSTLLRLLNDGHYDEVTNQLKRWVYVDGSINDWQEDRRKRESLMFVGASNEVYNINNVLFK